MDPRTVEKLEDQISDAIAEVIVKLGLKRLPLLPPTMDDALDGESRRHRV